MRLPLQVIFTCVFFVLLFLALPSQAVYNDQIIKLNSYDMAWKVFSLSGAELKEVKLQTWGQISNREYNDEEIKELYLCLSEALNIDGNTALQERSDGIVSRSYLNVKEKNEITHLAVQTIPIREKSNEKNVYLTIGITTSKKVKAKKVYEDLNVILEDRGFTEPLCITFTGEKPGCTNRKIREARIKDLARQADADYIEGAADDRYSSLSFYSNIGKQSLYVQGKKINLNIAFCKDERENKTQIHVGVPVIYQDY